MPLKDREPVCHLLSCTHRVQNEQMEAQMTKEGASLSPFTNKTGHTGLAGTVEALGEIPPLWDSSSPPPSRKPCFRPLRLLSLPDPLALDPNKSLPSQENISLTLHLSYPPPHLCLLQGSLLPTSPSLCKLLMDLTLLGNLPTIEAASFGKLLTVPSPPKARQS